MKRNEFKNIYELAKKDNVLENKWFICMGWFWLHLTEAQYKKMWNLILEQNDLPSNTKQVKMINGCTLKNPYL